MKIGKISEPMLKRSVLKRISYKDKTVFKGAGLSRDFASMNINEYEDIVLSTDTVVYGMENIALYGVTKTANNIATAGAIIKGILVSVTMPSNTMESDINFLMREIASVCKEKKIEIIGGHSETVPYVTKMVVTFTGVGVRKKECKIDISNIKPDMDIVMSKEIGLEGTAILAVNREEELLKRFQRSFVEMTKKAINHISIEKEAHIASELNIAAMHDVSRGGIFGALWEMAASVGLGVEVSLDKIRVRQETIEICELLGLNPYTLLSGGALLMVTEDGEKLKEELNKAGIQGEIIGKVTASNDRVVIKGEERRYLEPPKSDDIVKGVI